MRKRWLLLSLLLSSAPSLAQTAAMAKPQVGTCRVPESILPTQRFADDLRSKNLEDVLKLYTSRAVFIDPSGKQYRGPALSELFKQVFATFDSDIVMHARSRTRGKSSKVCIESGSFAENLRTRATGTTQHNVGSYRFTYQLQADGQW